MPLAGNVPVGRVTDDLRSAVLAKPMLEGRIDFQDATAAEAPRDDAYRRRPGSRSGVPPSGTPQASAAKARKKSSYGRYSRAID